MDIDVCICITCVLWNRGYTVICIGNNDTEAGSRNRERWCRWLRLMNQSGIRQYEVTEYMELLMFNYSQDLVKICKGGLL